MIREFFTYSFLLSPMLAVAGVVEESLLVSAIVFLASVVAFLWRQQDNNHKETKKDFNDYVKLTRGERNTDQNQINTLMAKVLECESDRHDLRRRVEQLGVEVHDSVKPPEGMA